MSTTKIEWTEATWNPATGCDKVSAGCKNCYAETMANRLQKMGQANYSNGFNITLQPQMLDIPLKRKKPTKYFVNSMSDLFHKDIPDEYIDKVFAVMALCPQHVFQILTKRPERMRDYLLKKESEWTDWGVSETAEELLLPSQKFFDLTHDYGQLKQHLKDAGWYYDWTHDENGKPDDCRLIYDGKTPLQNVWLGVSVENQKAADERIPLLLETPAAVRWLSCEPLLSEVDLKKYLSTFGCNCCQKIDWVVAGGESGNGARVCNVDWIRLIVHQCKAADVPVFVKQLGANATVNYYDDLREDFFNNDEDWTPLNWDLQDGQPPLNTVVKFPKTNKKGGDIAEFPEDLRVREFPKQ